MVIKLTWGLGHYRADGGKPMDAKKGEGFEICLYSCARTAVGTGDCEADYGSVHCGAITPTNSGTGKLVLGKMSCGSTLSLVEPLFEELDGLSVEVDDVIYMPSLDHPEDRPHPFVYFINIRNHSNERVQIQGRKWFVRENDSGDVIVVEGDGVVGQTPDLGPGEEFSYNSYHVARSSGYAEGAFFGVAESGRRIFVRIPRFNLRLPEWA